MYFFILLVLAFLGSTGAISEQLDQLDRLCNHTFPVTTASKEAQKSFDRGLTLAYSFGHYPAVQEF